ncbi:hypothetical protein [Rhodoferax sp.]|uniref:hypothetical protein n=1 Tax=Rhodoferax sp. TaxID=50421 RepID=UPI0025F83723|nr:hypothetical protein [Rhodoferax sp.]
MGILALLNHVVNFAAPALWLALLLPWAVRFLPGKKAPVFSLPAQFARIFLAGLVVLALGLALLGQDGKMMTYLALVVTAASAQWFMRKG